MNRSLHVPVAPGRKLGAAVCLLAVMMLWAPLWAMALEASGMSCCADGFCARTAHEHQKTAQAAAVRPSPAESPKECEHHGGSTPNKQGPMKCSMSCCHENSNTLATAVIFVLPIGASISVPLGVTSALPELPATEFMDSIEPLSPPPRITLPAV